ncbi:ABC transporter ATP-binding protein [Paenibacillus aceti]|uniref:ABC transporter antibiotic-transport ATP-binding protein n=1 Tax=Paenibacillus aceti TaxID=1820010 RepID=A0ABQ1VZX9_9BACL|nr:ABC transporter ATP-binding protein [Paenibacillus aceti]GGG06146.1 putative ABC transporter antibiotic-transport ATP-binding protein [Paenibacillus aceti]
MVEVRNLRYKYPGSKDQVLHGLDFSIPQGEIFGFLGPSGAGKSTAQKILIGILKQYEGKVTVLGREVRETKPDYYEKIGVAFEFPNFYGRFTAMENLSLFRSLYQGTTSKPEELLDRVGLAKYAHTKVDNFSKSMKMRLNLCRALLNQPEILFLDEPTSGLDPVNARLVKEMIIQMKTAGKTVLITTHNMQAAEDICDRIAFIVDGRIVLIDSPRQLKVEHGKRRVRVEYRKNEQIHQEYYELEGLGTNQEFVQLLGRERIETLHTEEATLEDIFIKATGRKLE